jgi:hypothetical protein
VGDCRRNWGLFGPSRGALVNLATRSSRKDLGSSLRVVDPDERIKAVDARFVARAGRSMTDHELFQADIWIDAGQSIQTEAYRAEHTIPHGTELFAAQGRGEDAGPELPNTSAEVSGVARFPVMDACSGRFVHEMVDRGKDRNAGGLRARSDR